MMKLYLPTILMLWTVNAVAQPYPVYDPQSLTLGIPADCADTQSCAFWGEEAAYSSVVPYRVLEVTGTIYLPEPVEVLADDQAPADTPFGLLARRYGIVAKGSPERQYEEIYPPGSRDALRELLGEAKLAKTEAWVRAGGAGVARLRVDALIDLPGEDFATLVFYRTYNADGTYLANGTRELAQVDGSWVIRPGKKELSFIFNLTRALYDQSLRILTPVPGPLTDAGQWYRQSE